MAAISGVCLCVHKYNQKAPCVPPKTSAAVAGTPSLPPARRSLAEVVLCRDGTLFLLEE